MNILNEFVTRICDYNLIAALNIVSIKITFRLNRTEDLALNNKSLLTPDKRLAKS